jgi:hypothetical protein
MCYSSENTEKRNAARVAYDLEKLIERDLGFDLHEVVHLLKTEGGAVGDRAASRLHHALCEFSRHRRYACRVLERELDR